MATTSLFALASPPTSAPRQRQPLCAGQRRRSLAPPPTPLLRLYRGVAVASSTGATTARRSVVSGASPSALRGLRPAAAATASTRPTAAAVRPRSAAVVLHAAAGDAPLDGRSPGSSPRVVQTDFLVLGSGIAGLTFALRAADLSLDGSDGVRAGTATVAVVTKGAASDGCTAYAQGGVSAVLSASDSVEAHVRDTLVAGDGACDLAAVEAVCGDGAEALLELVALGAKFDTIDESDEDEGDEGENRSIGKGTNGSIEKDGVVSFSSHPGPTTAEAAASLGLHLTREGGHSARRVAHAADATGAEVMRALLSAVRAHPRIHLYENRVALDLVVSPFPGSSPDGLEERVCLGADTAHAATRERCRFVAAATVLATGGAGRAFPLSTNPSVATGDGLAMALRAGVPAANLEFVQFHPTALAVAVGKRKTDDGEGVGGSAGAGGAFSPPSVDLPPPTSRAALVTEAARGEGGLLLNLSGERFMPLYDRERAELAPRDVVARAIASEMSERGDPHVLLDLRPLGRETLSRHFPTVTAACSSAGYDPSAEPVPVAPAQHYMCGGVSAGLSGQTSLSGLYAVGECAHSGLHGGNRLASNSLLEGLVFARRAADAADERAAPAAARRTREALGGELLRGAAASAPGLAAGRGGAGAPETPPASASERASRASPELSQWIRARRAAAAEALGASAGIVRTRRGLSEGAARLRAISAEVEALVASAWPQERRESPGSSPPPPVLAMPLELNELRNVLAVSEGIVACALSRKESLGGHYLADETAPRGTRGDDGASPLSPSSPPRPSSKPTVVDLETARAVCAAAAAELASSGDEGSSSSRDGRRGIGRRASTAVPSSSSSAAKVGGGRTKRRSKGSGSNKPLLGQHQEDHLRAPSSSSSPSPSRQPAREVAVRSLLGDGEGQ